MNDRQAANRKISDRTPYHLAVVGGGRTFKSLFELFRLESFSFLNIDLVGVCDIDPDAEGLRLAEGIGIYTTHDYRDLFKIKNLDYIIELTHDREVLLDLIRTAPKRVGVLDHRLGRLFLNISSIVDRLRTAEYHLFVEKMFSDFLIQESSGAIVVLNTDFTIEDANEAYLKQVDRSREAVIGAYCYEISHGLNAPCAIADPALRCPMIETLKTGRSAHVIHEINRSRRLKRYGNIVTYPLKNRAGEVSRVIEIWRDITKEIDSRWETRVAELKADLNKIVQEDRVASLGKLAASCAHEINNPIQGLLTFTRLMQNILDEGNSSPEASEDFKRYLSLMSRELERCGKIVSGLLSFSRSSPVGYTDIDLNEFFKEIVTLTCHKMELQNIQLVLHLSSRPLEIQGDLNQLQQCFLNLIFNAIEAMPEGGRLTLQTRLNARRKKVRIDIKDTGPGIDGAHLPHIFDPFFTTKEKGEGTGLGLSIVYGIVKNHKGDIKVDSRIGEGCAFVLTFPMSSPPAAMRKKTNGR